MLENVMVIDYVVHEIPCGGSTIRLGKYQYKSNAYNALKEFENWVINTNNIFLGHMSSSERTIINSYSIFQIPEDKDV